MVKSRFGYRTAIPSISTSKAQTKQVSFRSGPNSYKDNDDLKPTELAAAIDARFIKIGRYKTRKGLDRYTVPLGETVNTSVTSTTGPGVYTVTANQAIAQKLISTAERRITKAEINIRSTIMSSGVLLVEVYADNSGVPGDLLARSSFKPADITATFAYKSVCFVSTPLVTAGQVVWLVVRAQNSQIGSYEVSTTTSALTALVSTDNGNVWTNAPYAANVKLYTANNGGVKGLIRVYRPNGQIVTLFAAGDSVYQVNEGTGATSVIKSGLNPASTYVRFAMVQDSVRWVNGLEKPYKYDFTDVTQINECPIVPSNIIEHKGLIFYTDSEDKTKEVFSNFAEYDTFTSTDFIYAPGPKSADSLTAKAPLNGVLFFFSRNNKQQLYGSDNDTFQLDDAPSQRGTYSQESLVYDANFIYHANDDGVWKFNGTEDINLAESFLEEYLAITDKSKITLDVYLNRLYIFYAPAGAADNSECFVYNLQLGMYESKDLDTPIGQTFGHSTQEDVFIQASNKIGALYYGELSSNDYHNLGDQLRTTLKTPYNHFDTPGTFKRIPKLRPQFPSANGVYSVEIGFDKDFENNPISQSVSVSSSGGRYNTGLRYNTGIRYESQGLIEPKLVIPGTFKRIQRTYGHVAAREPFEFDSEILTLETQRLI